MAFTGLPRLRKVHNSPYILMRQANYFAPNRSFLNLNGLDHLRNKHDHPYILMLQANYFALAQSSKICTSYYEVDRGEPN
jgi:hypothetical protein